MPVNYVRGDATQPIGTGNQIITHCCNDAGYWNAGFVKAISRRWPEPERAYRSWATGHTPQPFILGQVQFIKVATGLCIANLIGQHGIVNGRLSNPPPIRYEAIREGLERVRQLALAHNGSIHMPRMGAGLAGGNWQLIAKIIDDELSDHGLQVTVYDLA